MSEWPHLLRHQSAAMPMVVLLTGFMGMEHAFAVPLRVPELFQGRSFRIEFRMCFCKAISSLQSFVCPAVNFVVINVMRMVYTWEELLNQDSCTVTQKALSPRILSNPMFPTLSSSGSPITIHVLFSFWLCWVGDVSDDHFSSLV